MSDMLPFRRPPNAPTTKNELFARLREILRKGWMEMPTDVRRYNGTGGPGNYLEDLIGLTAGNKDIADIIGWEVKFYTSKTSLITLFHKEPGPKKIIRYMVSRYGWLDDQERKSFRHTIRGESDKFIVANDAGNIIVRSKIGDGPVPVWTHDMLLNIAGSKLRRLMLVRGERDGRNVRFERVDCYQTLHLSRLMEDITNGTIAIDFDVREQRPGSNALRNHGTKFRVSPDEIPDLYDKHERVS